MTGLRQPLRAFSMLVAAALAAMPGAAQAQQKFPTKPIRFVVPFSPGGGTDTLARIIAQKMSENWGQSVVIENRTGAGGTIGTAIVAKATPDGHTLLVSSSGFRHQRGAAPQSSLRPAQGLRRRHPDRIFHEHAGRDADARRQVAEGLHRARQGAAGQDPLQLRRGTAARRT